MDFFVFYWLTINWWQLLAGLMRTLAAHDVENINWSDGSSRSWSKLAQLSFSKILTYGIKTYINDEPIFLTNYSNLHGTHYMPPGPENGRNFFGEPLGFKTTREPIRIDFFPFWGSLGAIFQKTLKWTFSKFWTFQRHYLSSNWT